MPPTKLEYPNPRWAYAGSHCPTASSVEPVRKIAASTARKNGLNARCRSRVRSWPWATSGGTFTNAKPTLTAAGQTISPSEIARQDAPSRKAVAAASTVPTAPMQ